MTEKKNNNTEIQDAINEKLNELNLSQKTEDE